MRGLFKRMAGRIRSMEGQSYVELALVLPVLFIMLLGLVEVALFIGRYLDLLDLSKEAARFASMRDPFITGGDLNCSTTNDLNFYYDTACILSPPAGSPDCTEANYCNGFNPLLQLNPDTDDLVITVFTVSGHVVTNQWPLPNHYWALSNVDFDANIDHNFGAGSGHPERFKMDCEGNVVRSEPYYTKDRLDSLMLPSSPTNKGYIAVEVYYCYEQVLGLPFLTEFVPNPLQLHSYTVMPLPAAQPTPTPIT